MKEFEFYSPTTITEACELLKKYKGSVRALAGGTDLIPKMYYKMLAPEHVVNLKRIKGLNQISFKDNTGLTVGALTRFNDIIYSSVIQETHPILVEVSQDLASHQVRNLATIGGNLCNAAPSADSAPVLIAMDSTVTITGPGGNTRELALDKFFRGPGATALAEGEILTSIHVPVIKPRTGIAYIKHTIRRALEIAIVGVAGLIQLDDDSEKCISSRLVIGACAPTPVRVVEAEDELKGRSITERDLDIASQKAVSAVRPISDVRGSEEYRKEMVQVLTKRVLELAMKRAKEVK